MKTYQKTIESKILQISYDICPDSPRDNDNIGYFFTNERRNISPDGNSHVLYDIMKSTGEEATSTQDHMERLKKEAKDIFYITPVYRYEHGNVVYRRGTAQGFDVSNCGFYIVTNESLRKIGARKSIASIEKIIDGELKDYTSWCNGEIYCFTLYDKDGEIEESCGGFYDMETIKEYLPKEWKNEDLSDYLE